MATLGDAAAAGETFGREIREVVPAIDLHRVMADSALAMGGEAERRAGLCQALEKAGYRVKKLSKRRSSRSEPFE